MTKSRILGWDPTAAGESRGGPAGGARNGSASNGHVTGNARQQQDSSGFERSSNYTSAQAYIDDVVANVVTSRSELFRNLMDPRRDVYRECGYPQTSSVTPEQYDDLFRREPIARRVVEILAKECWQVTPTVYDAEGDEVTPFEEAWDNLGKQLNPEQSYYKDEKGSGVWEYLQRLDVVSGIGRYGVLLIGVDDGLPLDQPVKGVEEKNSEAKGKDTAPGAQAPNESGSAKTGGDGANDHYFTTTNQPYVPRPYSLTVNKKPVEEGGTKGRKLKYLRVFPESLAPVVAWEQNMLSPRYGMPTHYNLTFTDPTEAGTGAPSRTLRVHWTRVIHVADNRVSSEVYGTPRMQPVLNNLLNLQKKYGSSAEGYWKQAFAALIIKTNPQLGGNVKVNADKMRNMIEAFEMGLQKSLVLSGMEAESLPPSITDPTPHIAVDVEAICIEIGVPVRVFKGSERGELASSQDDAAWNDRLKNRQTTYVTPRIIVPFVDRLITIGVLPEPKGKAEEPLAADDPNNPAMAEGKVGTDALPPGKGKPVADSEDDEVESVVANVTARALRGITDNAFPPKPAGPAAPPAPGGPPPVAPKPVPPAVTVGVKPPAEDEEDPGFSVYWPDVTSSDPVTKADVFGKLVTALAGAVSGGITDTIVTTKDLLVHLGGMDEELVDAMMINAAEAQEVKAEQEAIEAQVAMDQQEDMIERGLAPDPTDPAQQPPPPGAPPGQPAPAGPPKPKPPVGNAGATDNAFCATGPGGGVDPTCGKGKGTVGKVTEAASKIKVISDTGVVKEDGNWHQVNKRGDHELRFTASNGVGYRVKVQPQSNGEHYLFFDTAGSGLTGKTGTGASHEVFGKVMAAVVAFVNHKKPPGIAFGSEPEESRKRLYERLAKGLAKIIPGSTAHVQDDKFAGPTYVVTTRKDVAGKVLNAMLNPSWLTTNGWVGNAFCSTGEGGGVDPTCGKGNGEAAGKGSAPAGKDATTPATGKGGAAHAPAPKPPKDVTVKYEGDEAALKALVKKTFGRDVDPAQLAGAANGIDGAKAYIGTSEGGLLQVVVLNPNGSKAERAFYQDHTGTLVVNNRAFDNTEDTGPDRKSGAQIMLDQVRQLRELGVKKMVTQAQGEKGDPKGYVGYTVWPKLGYDGAMSDDQFGKLPAEIKTAMGAKKGGLFGLGKQKGDRSILSLHQTPGGAEAWAEHGSTFQGTFDLSDGSRSMKALDAYAVKRKLTVNAFCPTGKGGGVDPTCSTGGDSGGGGSGPKHGTIGDVKIDKNGLVTKDTLGYGTSSAKFDLKESVQQAMDYQSLSNQCYANAAKVVKGEKGSKYVEGVFISADGKDFVDHAWVEGPGGKLTDPTLSRKGTYHPFMKLTKEQLESHKPSIDDNRLMTVMKKAGTVDNLEENWDRFVEVIHKTTAKQKKDNYESAVKDKKAPVEEHYLDHRSLDGAPWVHKLLGHDSWEDD